MCPVLVLFPVPPLHPDCKSPIELMFTLRMGMHATKHNAPAALAGLQEVQKVISQLVASNQACGSGRCNGERS